MADNADVWCQDDEREQDLLCTLEEPEKTEFWPATVRAISPEGMWLYAASPFQPGTLLKTHLIHKASGRRSTWPVRVTSVWLEDGNGWAVQIRFTTPLDPAELGDLLSRTGANA